MNSGKKNNPRLETALDSKSTLSACFEEPIVKVNIKSGVVFNRLEKFWTEQTIKIKESAS